MSPARRLGAVAAGLACAVTLAACSGGSAAPAHPGISVSKAPPGTVATRWWSTSRAAAGSVIDAQAPTALAAKLRPSRDDYCTMLRQTIAAGGSILPAAGASDPARLVATEAFVAEIEHVAPKEVAGSWTVLGPALLALVTSGGDPARIRHVDASKVRGAAQTVAADARKLCGLDVTVPR